ncbi:hypothetical protein CORC01_13344 [Colletotrichum orchidophilum]|uniref:Uncharacterized protein n=1 Tax=Colletotrichum orchidophilum TaxID=1209926 RepID=A0A1G4AQB6_9PEZI|nr:uncharacterized protein CORC01_13344 [Colletotrichum orchidophilum]OHE91367.1 hypothetical protein CORC01_13344 [Colletotrichum orchidophilum]
MDDQFGGRTDDDLFFDDFEPVSNPQAVETVETVVATAPPPAAVATPPVEPQKPATVAPKPAAQQQHQAPPAPKPAPAKKPPTAPRGGLANSRFADPKPAPAAPRAPRQAAPAAVSTPPPTASTPTPQPSTVPAAQNSPAPAAAPTAPAPPPAAAPTPAAATPSDSASPNATTKSNSPAPPPSAPHAPREKHAAPGANTALNAEARLGSGANPRTKLSEAELAAKMKQMRILNAEKTRKFEQAEQDERSHAEAYARGMEEARQRKKLDEERRRRGEEERRRMDDERARNRERKLKAMSIKEGGWDEGKEALAAEEERRGFRGANGGIRGTRSGAGLAGSRFASREDDAQQGDRYAGGGSEERRGGRGRGRGGRGQGRGGRGGRGGYGNDHERGDSNGAREAKTHATQPPAPAPVISTEEFPALPGKATSGDISPPVLSPLGRWDDEMEAFDEKLKSAAAQSSS